jgi:hypothetical protein
MIEKLSGKNALPFIHKPGAVDVRRAFAFSASFNADQKAVQDGCGFGGGTHMSVTPCSYCSARGGQLGLPSYYRCDDCKARDEKDPENDKFVCRHTNFIHSEKLAEIRSLASTADVIEWKGKMYSLVCSTNMVLNCFTQNELLPV